MQRYTDKHFNDQKKHTYNAVRRNVATNSASTQRAFINTTQLLTLCHRYNLAVLWRRPILEVDQFDQFGDQIGLAVCACLPL